MSSKETDARIRIDKMLIEAGWKLPAWAKEEEINVKTEINNASGEADYVLLSSKENHLCTIEAKKTLLSPLVGKEQARSYANSLSCRFIILSNGILHYLWDLEQGNPVKIEKFPSQEDLE
ncbi:type I restriction enzyme HsdR N-terminal domain-containing protein, partial [Pelagibacteraceae bacterium]|nr:type I restriction enzyme HsdR N-terminal domain-containing protein [Pelagibacteraceae bacterium]